MEVIDAINISMARAQYFKGNSNIPRNTVLKLQGLRLRGFFSLEFNKGQREKVS